MELPKAAPVFLIIFYHKCLWIFLIYSLYIHIYFLNMFHIFPLVCFLIYGVSTRQVRGRNADDHVRHQFSDGWTCDKDLASVD